MIRVLQLTSVSSIGGAEHLLIWLARQFDRRRFAMHFVSLEPEAALHRALREAGAVAASLDIGSAVGWGKGLRHLRRLIQQQQIDIVHTHLPAAGLMGVAAKRFGFGGQLVHTRHYGAFYERYGSRTSKRLDRWIAVQQPRLIAISDAVRNDLIMRLAIAPEKIRRIHNAVDLEWLRAPPAAAEAELVRRLQEWRSRGRRLIATVANFHPGKGHRTLVEAAPAVLQRHPEAIFILIGGPGGGDDLHAEIQRRGLNDSFVFAGRVEAIGAVLPLLDLVVVPSILEGFGLVACEAMACGVPVVASAVEGLGEIVVHGETGRLAPPEDPQALAGEICAALEGDNTLQCDKARRRVEEYFSMPRMVAELENTYEDLQRGIW